MTRAYKRLSERSFVFPGSSRRALSGAEIVELSEMKSEGSCGGSKFGHLSTIAKGTLVT